MKLRNRKSLVNKRDEGSPPAAAPRVKLTKWIYFSILIFIAGYLGMTGVHFLLMVDKQGLVVIDRNRLSPERDGRVEELAIQEGDEVQRNQLLVRLSPVVDCPPNTVDPTQRFVKLDPIVEKLAFDLQMNENRLKLLDRRITRYPHTGTKPGMELALELQLAGIQEKARDSDRLEKLTAERDLLREELRLQRNTLLAWRRREALRHSALEQASLDAGAIPSECMDEEIRAPFDGMVSALHLNVHEYARHGRPLVTLQHQNAPVHIEIYTSPSNTPDWTPGKQVQVRFPDESVDSGVIETVQSSAYNALALERDVYVPSDTQLMVQVLPHNAASAERWRGYDRMRVRVRAWR